jgi:hypothetical protein
VAVAVAVDGWQWGCNSGRVAVDDTVAVAVAVDGSGGVAGERMEGIG